MAELVNPPRSDNPVGIYSAGRRLIDERYLIGWPDGIVKVGSTWQGRKRWGRFIARGGILLDRARYDRLGDAYKGELWLERELGKRYKRAFNCIGGKEKSKPYLVSGSGYLECFLIPESDWPEIIELARSVT